MKKILLIVLVFSLSITLLGCTNNQQMSQVQQTGGQQNQQQNDEQEKADIEKLVKTFGNNLQKVSLLAPSDLIKKSMQENYVDFVTPELLSKWQSDPQKAPGKTVSSPWPDRIEITDIQRLSDDAYKVEGKIIEITSVEKEKGGAAAKRPVTLTLKKFEKQWLIDDLTLGAYESNGNIVYSDTQYGFDFSLPKSWEGYAIVSNNWEGLSTNGKKVESGPIINIRHPKWSEEKQRQDIPIMIFTLAQWEALQKDEFHIGAAPVGPSELGRNKKYVFALPARYNFAFPEGYEEVEQILQGNPLKTTGE